MRGYFSIGVEGISKQRNIGALMRSAHAFGASFVYTIDAFYRQSAGSDTSKGMNHLPFYEWDNVDDMHLPVGCKLVGVELLDEAVELPSFHHPLRASYVLGPERGALSDQLLEKCDYTIKIPTSFCINVSMAGAIIMYDRIKSLGRFAPRPVSTGGPSEMLPDHVHGGRFSRKAIKAGEDKKHPSGKERKTS